MYMYIYKYIYIYKNRLFQSCEFCDRTETFLCIKYTNCYLFNYYISLVNNRSRSRLIKPKTEISLDLNSFSSIFLSFYFVSSGNEIKIFV